MKLIQCDRCGIRCTADSACETFEQCIPCDTLIWPSNHRVDLCLACISDFLIWVFGPKKTEEASDADSQ